MKRPVRSNITLFGALIEADNGNITARLVGTAEAVEEAKSDFKSMIENVPKEEQ